ncbi:MAG: hypothetical protein R3298_10940, partial [Gammaproteobacteria bacterium]|nr:hypothetical protein [Gammaproteobacteria bacterium]
RFGSLGLAPGRKFAPGHACRFECHDYVAEQRRDGPRSVGDLATFQRGNAVHYVHSRAMVRALAEAVRLGLVHRLVYPGE